MKKYLLVLFLIAFIVPSIAFASWWNPFSWFNGWTFHKTEVPQIQVETPKTSEEKINDLQKQLDDLKKLNQKTNTSQIAKPASSKNISSSFLGNIKTETAPSSKPTSSTRYLLERGIFSTLTISQSGGITLATIKMLDKGTEVVFMNDIYMDWSKISVDGQIGWVFSSSLSSSEPSTPKLSDMVKKWRPIVAYVECDFRDTNTNELYAQGSGSGVVIDFDGQITIITNRHVIADENNFQPFICRVRLPNDNNTFIGQKFMGGGSLDIGFIDINNPDEYVKNLTLISNSPLRFCKQKPSVGESILILGYPSIGSQTDITATEGIISGFDGNYFITSAKIEHGNSGGVAISLKSDCYLGIPSGVVAGELESLGRILDINVAIPK